MKRRSKYGNRKVERDGLKFDSAKEAARWRDLRLLERAGQIRNLRRQVRYDFTINGVKVGSYIADHEYDELNNGVWEPVTEDVKGFKTQVYALKRRMMLGFHNIKIREV